MAQFYLWEHCGNEWSEIWWGEICFKISNQNGKASIPYVQSGCSDCQGRDIDPWAKSRRRFTWHSDKESTCQCRRYKRHGFSPWVKKMLWRRKWKPAPVLLPRKFHKQRSLVGLCIFHRLWNCKELDVTEHTHTHTHTHTVLLGLVLLNSLTWHKSLLALEFLQLLGSISLSWFLANNFSLYSSQIFAFLGSLFLVFFVTVWNYITYVFVSLVITIWYMNFARVGTFLSPLHPVYLRHCLAFTIGPFPRH